MRSALWSGAAPAGGHRWRALAALAVVLLLAACASAPPKYTVDDGRKLDDKLVANIRAYGSGEQALRPAVLRSAGLKDPDCDKQWELPFAVATSDGLEENDRVAWARALKVDERLAVIATAPGSPLAVGDKLMALEGRAEVDAGKLAERLSEIRDMGKPFTVTLDGGRRQLVRPFEVCRGYARFVSPYIAEEQSYHWLMTLHPLQLAKAGLTEDEALWVVLWGQGLSEEGGTRMKAYHYGTQIVGTLYNLVTIASGLRGAAMAAEAAVNAAKNAAASVATDVLKQQLIEQGKALAAQRIRDGFSDAAQQLTRQQTLDALQAAAANRASLSGVSRIGATVFDRADQWAFERMAKLGGSQLAGLALHQKLIEFRFTSNGLVLDADRLTALSTLAKARGMEDQVLAILRGYKAEDLQLEVGSMPLASAPKAFSYDSPDDPGRQLGAGGLIDTMLRMPAEAVLRK